MSQAGVSLDVAIDSYYRNDKDIVNTIMEAIDTTRIFIKISPRGTDGLRS